MRIEEAPAHAAPGHEHPPAGSRSARARGPLHGVLIAGLVLLFFAPAFRDGVQFLHRDQGRLHHPMRQYVAAELARGHLPQWVPEAGLGMPVVAGTVDMVLHPLNALTILLPFELGLKLWLVLAVTMAGVGARFLARQLGASRPASLVAGVAFALCGFVVSSTDNMQYLSTTAAIPWMLGSGLWFAREGRPSQGTAVLLSSFFAAAGGDPQGWGLGLLAMTAASLVWPFGAPRSARARLLRAGVALVAALAGAAPVLVPMLAWSPASSRGEPFDWVVHLQYSMLPLRLAELGLPGLLRDPEPALVSTLYRAYAGDDWTPVAWVRSEYVGVTVLALAAVAAFRRREARWLALAGALAAWAALGRYAGFGQLARALPVLSNLRYWEKMAVWAHLAAAVLAALGVDALLGEDRRGLRRLAQAAAAVAGATAAAGAVVALQPGLAAAALAPPTGDLRSAAVLARNVVHGSTHAAALLAALAAVVFLASAGRKARTFGALLAGVVLVDLFAGNADAWLVSPLAITRGPAPILDALRRDPEARVLTPLELGTPSLEGLTPAESSLLFGARAAYTGWNVGERVTHFEHYTGMIPARAYRYRRRAGAYGELPGAGMWGVSHLVVPDRADRAQEAGLVGPWRVEVADPVIGAVLVHVPHRPRVYLAEQVRQVDRRGAMEFVLDGRNAAGPVSVVEAPLPAGLGPGAGDARIVRDEPERMVVRAGAIRMALLVLNDTYAPGWTATVDGQPAPILAANYLARGVWVPAGEHEVVFLYRTPGLREGWALFAAGLLGLGGWALLRRRRAGAAAA